MSAPWDVAALQREALRLEYMVGHVTSAELRRRDANYDRDSALGRELLFLISDDEWVRATSETIDVARSDSVNTTIKIDVDFDRITHEAFRDGTRRLWLPVLVLPPPRKRFPESDRLRTPEPDPFSTLTVTNAEGRPLATLPNTDVLHRIAAALAEIIVNMAIARSSDVFGGELDLSRAHRLLLSVAIYRVLRNEHVPDAVMEGRVAPWEPPNGNTYGIDLLRSGLVERLLTPFSNLLTAAETDDTAEARNRMAIRHVVERALRVLWALADSAVVVVAVERTHTPTVLTVTVPSRALYQALSGTDDTLKSIGWSGSWRWLIRPANWVLPRAGLRIDLLLPSADADRVVQINLPDGVSLDPSRPQADRAELEIKADTPQPVGELAMLTAQLIDASTQDPPELHQCLADVARTRADAVLELLRDHQIDGAAAPPNAISELLRIRGIPAAAEALDATSSRVTQVYRECVEGLRGALCGISDHGRTARDRTALKTRWAGGEWLTLPMTRRTSTDTVSPDVVVARARMIEDGSQRSTSAEARLRANIAVTDSAYFSTAKFSGWMSAGLMAVAAVFFVLERPLGIDSQQVSAEVLAFVLTLFSAIQAGRMEQSDRTTLRGMLAPAGNPLIVISILPPVILSAALAFSRSVAWDTGWALACIVLQGTQLMASFLLLRWALARGRDGAGGVRRRGEFVLCTDMAHYSHAQVLHSGWWRSTTAEALMLGRPAHAFIILQRDAKQTLQSLLERARPSEPDAGQAIVPHGLPANVLALQRSSTGVESLTFAVFRDRPKTDLYRTNKDVIPIDLDPSRMAPMEEPVGHVWIYLGLNRGRRPRPVADHPIVAVLRAAARCGLTVRDSQLPVPAPATGYAGLVWAHVRLGLRDGDVARLAAFLREVGRLAVAGGSPSARPVVGVRTVAEGIPRIINPWSTVANPGPAAERAEVTRAQLVWADDLDVVPADDLAGDTPTDRTWRVMVLCADARRGAEGKILERLDDDLGLAGMTLTVLHGKAVLLLLGHQPCRVPRPPRAATPPGPGGVTVLLDEWQSRNDLGRPRRHALLYVHMRTPDRPGATMDIVESLGESLKEMMPGALGRHGWNVWFATVVVTHGNVARIRLTIRLPIDPETNPQHKPVTRWGHAEFSRIEQRALALAAQKMAAAGYAGSSPEPTLGAPEDTVISVNLIKTPDLNPAADPQ